MQVGFQRRFDAGYLAVREAARSGRLGWLHTVRSCTADPAPPPASLHPASGGIFRDCAVHDFDVHPLGDRPRGRQVFATGANRGEDFFAATGDVDTAVAVLTLDDGTLAVCTATRYNGAGYDVRLEALGSAGTWSPAWTSTRRWRPPAGEPAVAGGPAVRRLRRPVPPTPTWHELRRVPAMSRPAAPDSPCDRRRGARGAAGRGGGGPVAPGGPAVTDRGGRQ